MERIRILLHMMGALLRLALAAGLMLIGTTVFGWGPLGPAWMFSEAKEIPIIALLLLLLLNVPFFLCWAAAILLILSVILKPDALDKAARVLFILCFWMTGLFVLLGTLIAVHNGQMQPTLTNLGFAIIFCACCSAAPFIPWVNRAVERALGILGKGHASKSN